MKSLFTSSAVSSSTGSAEQPAIINSLSGSSAEQPVRETAQPVKALRSITDVQWWLKKNEVVLSSSAEAVRIREVVEALSTKPKPRQETIKRFFEPWGVPQRIKKKHRPLPELIEELNTKVIVAAKELQQQLADSAERPLLLSHSAEQPVPMDTSAVVDLDQDPTLASMVSSAAQPGASSATPPAPHPRSFDIFLARRRHIDLLLNLVDPKPPPQSNPRQERPKTAFGLLQDCRKYKEDNWLGVEENKEIDKIMKALVIESQSHFSSNLCREIYKHTKIGEVMGPFARRDSQGHWGENDHEFVRAVAFDLTARDLASFLRGQDALRAEKYPYMARLETLGVKVIRQSDQKIYEEKTLEILQDMPDTKVLPLLPDYAEHEWLYRMLANIRDIAAGIPIQEEDGEEEDEEEEDEEMKAFREEVRKKDEFMYECRRKWKEQGKTEEECKMMCPQALADWRAENEIAADFDAMQI